MERITLSDSAAYLILRPRCRRSSSPGTTPATARRFDGRHLGHRGRPRRRGRRYRDLIEAADADNDPVTEDIAATILADEAAHRTEFRGFRKEYRSD